MKTGQTNSVVVTGQEDLDPAPVIAETSKVTLNLTVNSDVANAHIVSGLPQRKCVNPNTCQMYTEIKYVKSVSCVGHLSSVNLVANDKQECSRTGRKSELTGFLQPAIFGTQTQQPVETGPGPEHLEHLFKHRVVQDGDPRDNKNLPTGRGVGHIHRFQRRLLPHTNSQSVKEVHAFSPPGSVLPVQSPTLWPIHSPHGVHSGGQRGQTHGSSEGYKDPPVPRRLAGESLYLTHLSPAYSNPSHTVPGARVAGEQGKIRTGSQTGLQLRRLPVRPERGQGQTNRRSLADLDRQDQIHNVGSVLPGPTIHVPHRPAHSNRKTSPLRASSHETHTVALEKQLEGPRVTGKGDTGPQVPSPPPEVVAGGKQCASRSTITPSKTCSANLYRRIKRRVGALT